MSELINSNKSKLNELFANHKLQRVYLFGSAVKGKLSANSDIDFLVKFKDNLEPLEKSELWWNLHDSLRDIFKREIDLVTEKSLKNPYFIKELDKTKKLIYGK